MNFWLFKNSGLELFWEPEIVEYTEKTKIARRMQLIKKSVELKHGHPMVSYGLIIVLLLDFEILN